MRRVGVEFVVEGGVERVKFVVEVVVEGAGL